MSRTRTRTLALLGLVAGSLLAAACSESATAPRPEFACETLGSGTAAPCPPR